MRIHNLDNDSKIDQVGIFLTPAEAGELRDALQDMLGRPGIHHHVSGDDYKKEITVAIYDSDHLEGFDERTVRLIEEDL